MHAHSVIEDAGAGTFALERSSKSLSRESTIVVGAGVVGAGVVGAGVVGAGVVGAGVVGGFVVDRLKADGSGAILGILTRRRATCPSTTFFFLLKKKGFRKYPAVIIAITISKYV
jgi:hypothetical protein